MVTQLLIPTIPIDPIRDSGKSCQNKMIRRAVGYNSLARLSARERLHLNPSRLVCAFTSVKWPNTSGLRFMSTQGGGDDENSSKNSGKKNFKKGIEKENQTEGKDSKIDGKEDDLNTQVAAKDKKTKGGVLEDDKESKKTKGGVLEDDIPDTDADKDSEYTENNKLKPLTNVKKSLAIRRANSKRIATRNGSSSLSQSTLIQKESVPAVFKHLMAIPLTKRPLFPGYLLGLFQIPTNHL